MKLSDKLTKISFDDKDIAVDGDLWDWFLGNTLPNHTPYCVSQNDLKALFYIDNAPFEALLLYSSNRICVTPKTLDYMSNVKADEIVRAFESWNNEKCCDIYCTHDFIQRSPTEITLIIFKYYHTDPELAE